MKKFGVASVCSGIEAVSDGLKKCSKCLVTKTLAEFHSQPSGKMGRHSYCSECACSIQRSVRNTKPRPYSTEQKRRWHIRSRYKASVEQIEALYVQQGGKCGICKKPLRRYHIDHDHRTKIIRGLLCHRCNVRIGGWEDQGFREAALRWIERGLS